MDPISTRTRLLEAATTVFLEHGFDTASMDMVRQPLGSLQFCWCVGPPRECSAQP